MKFCIAQTRPERGDIIANIKQHKNLIERAIANGAEAIFFPELSLTGYEPTLAKELATDAHDARLSEFQDISDKNFITICAGLPTPHMDGTRISMVIIQPKQSAIIYSKQFLHEDETAFFVPGNEQVILNLASTRVGLAICYELTIPKHQEYLFSLGTSLYLASVAKTSEGMVAANRMLEEIARKNSVYVAVSNCIGICDDEKCGGGSAVWDPHGKLLVQMDTESTGIIIMDLETGDGFIEPVSQ
jgi:predicted amidohydrolase